MATFVGCNYELSYLAVQFTFPLAVNVHLGDFDYVAEFETQRRLVVGVRNARLFDSCICR